MSVHMAQTVSLEDCELRLLGTPRVLRPGRADYLLERRDAALLTILTLRGAMSRRSMAETLWPDVAEKMAQTNLRQRLFRLRRNLALDLFEEGEMLALRSGLRHDLDALAAPHLLAIEPVPLGAMSYLDCEPLAEQVQHLQQQWLDQRRRLVADQAEALEAQGRLAEALTWAQHLTLNERSSEHAHRRLMRLHYRRGDRTAALAAYRSCQESMQQELGLQPSSETRALAELIERSEGAGPASALPESAYALTAVLDTASSDQTVVHAPVGGSGAELRVPQPAKRRAAHAPALAAALWRPPRLVGREREWLALEDAAQRGQVLLLQGEAGIGKTRLAQDFCAAQGSGLLIKATAADMATPYAFLARCLQSLWHCLLAAHGSLPAWAQEELARILPTLGVASNELPATPLQPLRLQSACSALLQACRVASPPAPQPAALSWLLLDDLQWIDSASLECLLPVLSQAQEAAPAGAPAWLCVLTLRRDEALPEALKQWLQRETEGLFDLTLGPLLGEDLAAFVSSLALPQSPASDAAAGLTSEAELLAKLQRRTGGRPLFILELLRAAAGQLSHAVAEHASVAPPLQTLIAKRLATLSAPAQRLLRVAALLGPRFRLDWVAAVLAQHPVDLVEPWLELQAAQFMDDEGFAFDLAAEVAAHSVPEPVARLLHTAIAPVLQAAGVAAPVVAEHWQQAQQWAEAAQQWRLAAEQARLASRRVEELGFLARAELCLQRMGAQQPECFELACLALQAAMVVESPEQVHRRLADLLAQSQGDAQRLKALLLQARYEVAVSGQGELGLVAKEALALAQQLGEASEEARAAAWLGISMVLREQAEAALSLFADRLDAVQAQTDARLKIDFLGAYGYVLHGAGRYAEAVAPLTQAAALAEELGDLSEAADQLGNLAICQQFLGQRQASQEIYRRIKSVWERMGRPGGAGTAANLMHVASSDFGQGRYAEALELLEWCLKEFRQGSAPVWTVITENRLALVFLRLGQWARARQAMTPLPEGLRVGNRIARLSLECRLDALAGQRVLPRLLQAEAEWVDESVDLMDRCLLALNILRYEAAERALVRCDRLLASLPQDLISVQLSVSIWRADALRRLRRGSEAAQQVRQVLHWLERCLPVDMELVEFWWMAAQALTASTDASDRALAQQLLTQAREWTEAAGPHVPAAFVRSFLESKPFSQSAQLKPDASQPMKV
ncbi:AAA family ATPase [Paucibacter sp. Y2R2-4]|uniref:AAA family ATPase n=1 Tax=Paucibacter sp. Y2R2-4 TaxID=2893553 RepID=UPI0021E4D413|nr:AAA family ATPase [Paucibacter sp. Y2R2-4]MCV2348948.1 AAA family ATPase [Paucibacter sp. Y2R2-4]